MTDQHTEQLPNTQGNPDPAAVFDLAAATEENARLRAQLLDENAKLQEALDKSRASGLEAQGLSDEDVRRLEHPDEFVVTDSELRARLAELESAANRVATRPAAVAVDATAGADVATSYVDNGDGTWTRTDGARGRFGPDGFTVS